MREEAEGVEVRVQAQQRGCAVGGSPLYTRVLDAVLADVRRGGPCREALVPYGAEPVAHAGVLRFLAALHERALDGSAPALAAHYPSCGGTPGDDVEAVFLATVADHVDWVRARTALPLQTNEVGRSVALLGGYLEVARAGLPLRVLEVGASAGLNLRFDRFRYESGGQAFGPPASPVRFVEPWIGVPPALATAMEVVERRGCDTQPLDPRSASDRLRLRACLWPDQVDRRRRLDGALAVAAEVPAPVDRADAAAWAVGQLAAPVPGVATVIVHTIVAQYLPSATRHALEQAIADAGARATAEAPVAWLRMEPADERQAEVGLTRWPAAPGAGPPVTEVLARSAFHGPPVRGRAASPF